MNAMRILPLLVLTLLTTALGAQTSGRYFRRDSRLPQTPAASPVVDASVTATANPAPLRKLRSGRPWPRHHFGRLPEPVSPATGARAVDANATKGTTQRRGFWRAPR
jgi:hypothetical protein